MFVHIVMFKFATENKAQNLLKAKQQLESLVGRVPSLLSMEVGIDELATARSFDLSLYSTFESRVGLSEYAVHPEHLKVVAFIKSVAELSRTVDYER